MDRAFILSCCSTVDLPCDDMERREIPVLSYSYLVDIQTIWAETRNRISKKSPLFTAQDMLLSQTMKRPCELLQLTGALFP